MKDWYESDLSGSYPRRKELQRTREVGQESKEKEVKQECGIKPSCTKSDFGPIPWGARARRAGVLTSPFCQSLREHTFPGTSCFGAWFWQSSLVAWSCPPKERGCEGTRVDKGRGNEMVRHGAHAGHRSGELGR